jgi:signal transduction histidine kinase
VKFVADGKRPEVRIWSAAAEGEVTLHVRDNGIGIASEDRTRLFKVFSRGDAATAYPGTGLGLATTRRAIERCGGRIDFESRPGEGSTFRVTLKAAEAAG